MKYLPKETCKYLVSLGCVSESDYYFLDGELVPDFEEWHEARFNSTDVLPAFSLEDILRKDNAEKIWGKGDYDGLPFYQVYGRKITYLYQNYPDTWPEEVAKLIKP